MTLLVSLVFIAIIALELPKLLKQKKWRDIAVFSALLLIGMIYSYGQILDLPLPNPTDAIDAIFEPISKFVNKALS